MQLKLPFSGLTKGRLLAVIICGTSLGGIVVDVVFPESSPLTLIKQEAAPRVHSIYISGEVMDPGVYQIQENTKLVEVIAEAGGFSINADPEYIATSLNLAAVVNDQEHFHIPRVSVVGEQAIGSSGGGVSDGKININSASLSELITLPGIGESTAQKIIAGRPFKKREDLLNVSGIGEAKLSQFGDLISF